MKKTTKLTALVLALVLTLALALTGCGKLTKQDCEEIEEMLSKMKGAD